MFLAYNGYKCTAPKRCQYKANW